ncbi:Ig-like domain-containing protein [Klebsiella quasipneumoniae]
MSERSYPDGNNILNKAIAIGCIFLQLLSPLSALVIAIPTMVSASEQHMLPQNSATQTASGVNPFEQNLAKGAVALGTTLSDEDRTSSEALSDYARAQATDVLNSNAELWLSKYGTAKVQLNLEKHGKLGDSSVDWLVPLYDSPKNMLFTQLGLRQKDDRKTLNLGIGSRFFTDDNWMLGVNTFFDSDLRGRNYRLGIGAEAWSDYVKFSGNVYRRLSGWHQSRDLEDYDERPANGFDLRLNGFLPAYPQLGGTLVYEQYFGDEVALFGEDNRQKDPYAFTVGANYTPIPMLTFSAEQRMGKSDQNELNLALNMTWQLDKSLRENLSPDSVAGMRKLSHSRYDLVERNNDIVLEYRKQQVIRLSLAPEEIAGPAGSQQRVAVNITAKHGVKNIQLQGASFKAAGGIITPIDALHYTLTLPAWQQTTTSSKSVSVSSDASRILNTYVLSVTAEDNEGNHSSPEQLKVEVLPPVARFAGDATVSNDFAQPDGVTPVTLLYRVVDDSNKPLTGEDVAITATFADGTTSTQNTHSDTSGNASLELTSTVAGEAKVAARLTNGESNLTTVHYVDAQPDAAHSSLTASPETLVANGTDKSTLTLTLQDSQSRPVSGLDTVNMTLSGVAGATVSSVSETGAGHYTATLSGTTAGTVTVTPTIGGAELSGVSTNISLIGDSKNARVAAGNLAVVEDNAPADGSSQNLISVKVTDEQGNLIAGQAVQLRATNGAVIAAEGTSNDKGTFSMPVTSNIAGVSTITATLNGSSQSVDVTFVADNKSAQIASGDLSVITDNALANGTAENQIQVKVTDQNGNPLSGQTVDFSADNGAVVPASGSSGTDGMLQIPVTSKTAGSSTVTATVNGSSQSVDVTFIADGDSAQIAAGALTVVADKAVANGSAANQVQATVTDQNGNPVAGAVVSFTADNGATISAQEKTDELGQAVAQLTSKTAGISTVTATVNGSNQTVTVAFTADSSTVTLAEGDLTVTADNALANGSAANQVQLRVTDANGNPVADQPVSLSASNGAVIAASGTSGQDGLLSLPVTSLTAGISTVTATVNGSSQQVDVTFIADGATAQIAAGDISVTADKALANGSAANQVQVRVTDANGNAVADQAVSLSASNGAVIAASGTSGPDGLLSLPVTSLTAGISTVTATVNGSSQSVEVTFIADGATAQIAAGDISVTADKALANGSAANQVQVRVSDANGNAIADQAVSLSASNGAVIAASGTTGADGLLSLPVTSLTAGISTVTATVNGSSQHVDVTFVADSSSAGIATGDLTVVANNAIANGTAVNTVKVRVTDANGNPLAGQTVALSASNGATPVGGGATDDNGELLMNVTSTVAGISTVTATVNGSSQKVDVTFVADSDSAQIASGDLSVINDNALANGTAENKIQVKVTDRSGNVVSGQSVTFKASNGATVPASGTSGTDGILQIPVTSKTAGSSTVTATVNGSDAQIEVQFTADESSAQIASGSMQVTADKALANGTAENRVQLLVTDANDNPLAGQTVSFSASNGAMIASSGTTGSDGKVELPVTTTVAGSSTIIATVKDSSQSVEMSFVADSSTAQIATGDLSVLLDNAVANGTSANKVEVLVTDANGNPLAGQAVGFSANNGAVIADSGTTGSDGKIALPVTATTAGSSTVIATVNGSSQSINITFVADASTATIASGNMTITVNNALANSQATNGVRVVVTDGFANPLKDQTVSFTASNGAVIAAEGVSDAMGVINETITSIRAGESQITATVNGTQQSVTVIFVADGDSAQIATGALTVVADKAIANGSAANQVRATVTDQNNNPVAGAVVSFTADNGATISAQEKTDEQGQAVAQLTSKTAGISTVTATVNGSSQQVDVTFIADGATAQIAAGDISVTADKALANGSAANQVQVRVTDANGNAVADQAVSLSASNGAVIAASGTTGADGLLSLPVTSLTAGISTVTATVNDSSRQVDVTFVADSSSAGIATGDLTVAANNAIANGTAVNTVKVRVTDANGNPLAGQTVALSASNGATPAGGGATDDNGELLVNVTSTVAGVSTVTATINDSNQSVDVTFIADGSSAAIAATDMVALNNNAKANGSDPDNVQVTVRDSFGNPVPDQQVSFTADNAAVVEASGTTDAQGIVTMPVVSRVAGTSNVTASINGSSQSLSLTFIADSSTAQILARDIVVTQNGALSDGIAQNLLQVKVTDANGNVVSGVDVAFTASNGASVAASATANTDGLAVAAVTSKQSGTSLITASVNGSSQSAEMTFIAATIPVITSVVDNVGTITGNISGGQVTNDPQPELQGESDKNAIIQLFDNDTLVATGAANESGVWSITPDAVLVGEGDHRLTVKAALTESSDWSPSSEAFILNLDTIAQIPTIDSVTDSAGTVAVNGMTNGDNVQVSGTTEAGATVSVYVMREADRVRSLLGKPVADEQGHWEVKVTDMRIFQTSGAYEFRATTTDIAGNSSKEADMTGYQINYESWPAPSGTPEYVISGDGENVSEQQVTSLLSSTGSALFTVQAAGGYTPILNLPASSAGNSGNRVYVSVGAGTQLGVKINGIISSPLDAGTDATWYSNGSDWKRIY